MSEQEAFKTWLKDNNIFQYEEGEYHDPIDVEVLEFSSMVWQASAERKDADLNALRENLITANDIINVEMHRTKAIIDQLNAELAALREFAKYIIKAVNESKTLDIVDINDAARDTNLIDQSGKPTALLTGEKE